MICAQCGTANEAGRKFCRECGTRLTVVCRSCGTGNAPDAKFCGECGTALDATAAEGVPLPTTGGPSSAPSARAAGSAIGSGRTAERRLVSVLFADLVGFTPFAEQQDAEQVRETLGRYFDAASAAIERHGGRVEKFIGDAVMAVWGTPTAHEDDAERAVRAALELLPSVQSVDPELHARAAVVTGEAAVDPRAGDQQMVAGDLVNTAARLQAAAPPDTVLVGESTMRAAESAVVFEPAGDQQVKGKSLPVPAWRAVRVVAERGGRHRSEALEPPFVGRAAELQLLKELLHATAREQRPRLVAITGPGGIGKSRLAWELEKYVDGLVEGIYWHHGRSPSYGEGVSFWALGEMVRQRANLAETDGEETVRERVAATVAEFVPADERAWIEGALLTLLGVEPPPAGGRDVLFGAWRTFFEHVARHGTSVLLFEDLQWADAGTIDFIDHLLEWARGVPLLVLVLARPELFEAHPDFARVGRQFASVPLEPLSDAEMRELMNGVVPGLPETAAMAIIGRAGGIPLYAVETIRMLISDRRLDLIDGRYVPADDLDNLAVPASLRLLIRARLDALEPVDRSILENAAVAGQTFTVGVLEAVSGIGADDLAGHLRRLARREILTLNDDARSPGRGQYGFAQSMIREVAYGTLSRRDRRERHLAAARHIEALGQEELAGALASHYLWAYQASEPGAEADAVGIQTRLALRGAAERARNVGAYEQAASFLRQALDVTGTPTERAELLYLEAGALVLDGRYAAAAQEATAAATVFDETGDREAAAKARALTGTALIYSTRLDDAVATLEQAVGLATDGTPLMADLQGRLARAYMRARRIGDAVAAADRALAIAEVHDMKAVIADALNNRASAIDLDGRWREALILLEGALKLSLEANDLELQLRIRNNLASSLQAHDPLRSIALLREGVELARKLGIRSAVTFQTAHIAAISSSTGDDWDGVIGLLAAALETAADNADRAFLISHQLGYGFARAEVDERDLARWDAVADRTNPDHVAFRHAIVASAALSRGDAEKAYEEVMVALRHEPTDIYLGEWATRAALWMRDQRRALDAAEFINRDSSTGPWTSARRAWTSAVLAALEGRRTEAINGFLDAHPRWSQLGVRHSAALVGLDAAIVYPGEPALKGLVESAHAELDRIGSVAYARLLERAVGSGGVAGRQEAPGPKANAEATKGVPEEELNLRHRAHSAL